jgi:ATP phosphoribosyltransferase regulatory subunit (EC 2.4.2.17)
VLKRFPSISGNPDDAIAELRALTTDAKLDLAPAIDQFESRVGFMAARGIDVKQTRFSTAFGRGLDYYTGFEFELHHRGNGAEPLVAGGRYDGLMTQLGSNAPIPAVGFSVWVDALTKIGRKVGA